MGCVSELPGGQAGVQGPALQQTRVQPLLAGRGWWALERRRVAPCGASRQRRATARASQCRVSTGLLGALNCNSGGPCAAAWAPAGPQGSPRRGTRRARARRCRAGRGCRGGRVAPLTVSATLQGQEQAQAQTGSQEGAKGAWGGHLHSAGGGRGVGRRGRVAFQNAHRAPCKDALRRRRATRGQGQDRRARTSCAGPPTVPLAGGVVVVVQ